MLKKISTLLVLCLGLLPLSLHAQNEAVSALQKAQASGSNAAKELTQATADSLNNSAQTNLDDIQLKLSNAGKTVAGVAAEATEVSDDANSQTDGIEKGNWTATVDTKLLPLARAPGKKAPGKIVLGQYVARDSSAYNGLRGASMQLYQDSTGQYHMTNIYNLGDTIKLNLDAANGTVTIAPQVVYKSGSLEYYMYSADWANHTFNPNANITGTLGADGTITLGSWGIFSMTSATSASVLNGFVNSKWIPSDDNTYYIKVKNSSGTLGDTVRFATLVEQTAPKEIAIINFINNGRTVYARITPDKKIIVSPQILGVNPFYGNYLCYPNDATGKKVDAKSNIIGTYADDGTITFGNFVVVDQSTHTHFSLRTAKYTLKTDANIVWPEKVAVNFAGQGTASSPYLLKTSTDVEALSQSVEDGENYLGKYFQVANDIDLSGVQSYVPIGNATTGFAGTLDGNNKTLKGLNIVNRGSSDYGLFGYLSEGSSVKNLTLDAFNIQGSGSNVGALAGEAYGAVNGVKVTNLDLNVTGAYAGGLTGIMRAGVINNSSVEGTISAYGSVGGLSGTFTGHMANSHVKAIIRIPSAVSSTSNNDIGGIASVIAMTNGDTTTVSNCYVSGQIIDETGYSYVGGIGGIIGYSKVDRCFNVANISAETMSSDYDKGTAGIVGSALESQFTDCYNAGTVVKSGTSDNAGGITGSLSVMWTMSSDYTGPSGMSHFTNCYNSGVVISNPSSNNTHRGIFGKEATMHDYNASEHYFTNCYSDMTATAMKDTIWGKTTEELTNGTLPAGFSSTIWQATKGYYPVFKDNASTTASLVSAANVLFKAGETPAKFKSSAALRKASSLKAQLYNGDTSSFAQETSLLKITGDSLFVKSNYGNGILVIGDAAGYEARMYSIAAVPKVFEGEGTKASPYLIRNKEDFKKLNEAVYVYGQSHEDDYFLMTNDIDFKNASDFHGVGYGDNARTTLRAFNGDFNGGGHHIKGLYIKSYALDANDEEINDSCYNYGALFRIVERYGSVHDLIIDKDNTFRIYAMGGSVVGYLAGKVYNVKNYAEIQGYRGESGGIVGQVAETGVVSNSYNAGRVISGTQYIGGIVGENVGTIDGCQNDGDVISTDYEYGYKMKSGGTPARGYIGGIAGASQGVLSNNVNQGTVTGKDRTGGIVGYAVKVTLKNNLNTGIARIVTADPTKGGIAGYEGSGNVYENNYYDGAINVYGGINGTKKAGATAVSTASLISGTLPAGLDANVFKAEAGKYPVLKNFASEEASKALSETYINFGDGELSTDIQKEEQLSKAANLTWKLTTGKNYTITNNTLKLTSISADALAADTVVATNGSYVKDYYIGSIPKILPGSGTKADPFRITSKDDINKIANFITTTNTTFPGYYFKVLNDIDYGGDTLQVVAPEGYSFNADFDGNGKTISGYVLDDQQYKTGRYIGFFGTVGADGYIHDLTLNGKLSVYQYSGCAVAKLYGTIRNVVNKGTITSKNGYTSGLVCDLYEGGLVDSCRNEGPISAISFYTAGVVCRMYAGSTVRYSGNVADMSSTKSSLDGVVEEMMTGGTVDHCYNTGKLTSTAAGVVGIVGNIPAKCEYSITNCYNTGEITGTSNLAGIVSTVKANCVGVIDSCYNTANINGTQYIGGIAYNIAAGTRISNCYNTGTITATKGGTVAGVIGTINAGYDTTVEEYPTSVDHCYNTGDITSAGNSTGGLIGDVSGDTGYPTVSDCYNLGTVISSKTGTSVTSVGGLTGSLGGKIIRCWNAGEVSTDGFGAGGLGSIGEAQIEDCFNAGNIQASATKLTKAGDYGVAGGLVGYSRSDIYNSFNIGEVSGPFALGGVEGSAFSDASFVNTYNAGKITTTTNDDKTSNLVYISENYIDRLDSVTNNYFDNSVNKTYDFDSQVAQLAPGILNGLATRNLYNASLGDHFAYNRAAYPVIKTIEEPAVQNFFAADTLFQGTDNAQHVTQKFYVGALDSVKWTSSPNIVITDNGEAFGHEAGAGWVKKTVTFKGVTFEKQYDVTIVTPTGINDINVNADGEGLDLNQPMFNVAGQRVSKTYRGVVVQKGHKYVIK